MTLRIDKILPNGDCGLLIRFVESSHTLAAIHALARDLLASPLPAVVNVIPATDSLVLVFAEPIDHNAGLLTAIKQRIQHLKVSANKIKTIEIPVCYDAAVAPDLKSVCEALELSLEQLIAYHVEAVYRVDMLGFLPGFAYLSGNHFALDLPRKAKPSIQVPVGSVAIAGLQTGIYSLSSPGGWHVIGRTPKKLLDWDNEQQPMQLKPLDEVKFKAINLSKFKSLSVANGSSEIQ